MNELCGVVVTFDVTLGESQGGLAVDASGGEPKVILPLVLQAMADTDPGKRIPAPAARRLKIRRLRRAEIFRNPYYLSPA